MFRSPGQSYELFSLLKGRFAIISDTLQKVEHSVEAMIPFLQYFDKDISIISILVPAMRPDLGCRVRKGTGRGNPKSNS